MFKDNLPKIYRNSFHRARLNIIISTSWLNEYLRNFMDDYELTGQQYNILRIIERNEDPLSINQIRDQMYEKMSDASRLIDRLILKGLVEKKVSTHDKRLVEIFLTEKGKELLAKIFEQITVLDQPLKGLTETEANILSDLLTKMRLSCPV